MSILINIYVYFIIYIWFFLKKKIYCELICNFPFICINNTDKMFAAVNLFLEMVLELNPLYIYDIFISFFMTDLIHPHMNTA